MAPGLVSEMLGFLSLLQTNFVPKGTCCNSVANSGGAAMEDPLVTAAMCLKNVLTLIDPMLQSAAQAHAIKRRVLSWIGAGATKIIVEGRL